MTDNPWTAGVSVAALVLFLLALAATALMVNAQHRRRRLRRRLAEQRKNYIFIRNIISPQDYSIMRWAGLHTARWESLTDAEKADVRSRFSKEHGGV